MTDQPEPEHGAWPFFDDAHRALMSELADWTRSREDLLSGPHDDPYEASERIVSQLGSDGWLEYVVPQEQGGIHPDLDVRSLSICREQLAFRSGLADFAFAMQGLGGGPITLFGTGEQKDRYLKPVSSGDAIAAFALTEKESGSDVSAIQTELVKDGDAYRLEGEKTYISNAGLADFYVVFARNGEGLEADGQTAVILEEDVEGFAVGEHQEVTSPHPLGTLEFHGCPVSDDQIVGQVGEGLKVALATLDVFRTTVGAAALGFARRAFQETAGHVLDREVFDQKLFDFQMTQQKVADMATDLDAAALLVYRAAWHHDTREGRVTEEASKAKLFATEKAQEIIDEAVQLHGGEGVITGNTVEELYRAIRPLRIYEGASELQKVIIARELRNEFAPGSTGKD